MEQYPSQDEQDSHRPRGILRSISKGFRGGQMVVPRQGGGVRVAVFPVDLENPMVAIEKTIELRRLREDCAMPFDSTTN